MLSRTKFHRTEALRAIVSDCVNHFDTSRASPPTPYHPDPGRVMAQTIDAISVLSRGSRESVRWSLDSYPRIPAFHIDCDTMGPYKPSPCDDVLNVSEPSALSVSCTQVERGFQIQASGQENEDPNVELLNDKKRTTEYGHIGSSTVKELISFDIMHKRVLQLRTLSSKLIVTSVLERLKHVSLTTVLEAPYAKKLLDLGGYIMELSSLHYWAIFMEYYAAQIGKVTKNYTKCMKNSRG